MFFSKTGQNALQAASGRAWLPISSGIAAQHRCLSASPALRAAHILSFGESSNPKLAELLDHYRTMVILPTYLAPEQRRKIYKEKLKHILQNDPITMEIDGVVHKFRYRSRVRDLPSSRDTLKEAFKLISTPADLHNIPPLLAGVVRAGHKLDPWQYSIFLRRAAELKQVQLIMDCIRAVERTGFKLNNSRIINELLVYLQQPAIISGWDEAKTKTALKQVRLVLNILESDESHLPKGKDVGAFPFYRDPQVLASRLHMAAARAVYLKGDKDDDGQVAKYAQELVTLWPEDKGLLDLQPDESYQKNGPMRYILDRNSFLFYAAPVLNGLALAARVVDPDLAKQLQNRAGAVKAEVQTALGSLEQSEGRGITLYNAIFNPQEQGEQKAEEKA
ncbi:hypothetical protein F5144DRAFT_593926 [Chaetomium tenue]|uniref:Uncharacterized protein n=1 Tax=Chaetomium tenue TaxID=1854479 RepID=A0ACB7P1G2_9PEZI|nr:hypothetical protein F5144DRAFT_593926 [Chaetomium globosum]